MWKKNNNKMHGFSDIGPNVPAFLIKLWKLVNDPETDELISWSESGMSFIIHNPAQFAKELLSLYYKHNNMASFIRQLNMYGFHKIVSEFGGTKNDKDYMEFAHQCFLKDHVYLLENIKRKLPNPKAGVIINEQLPSANVKNGTQSEILSKILSDVNNLKGKQESWDARLASMKKENEALWKELAIFRQKHLKQEQIINRLIHFIVTIVQPSRNVSLRRRYPLMINDIQPVKKITKLSGPDTGNLSHGSPTGPTIHEIDTTDVIFGDSEQTEQSSGSEFISTDLTECFSNDNVKKTSDEEAKTSNEECLIEKADKIPEDWLEIQMTEGDLIDPLTPIDPAKINPAVAAATLKHLEGSNKRTPIAITIPSVATSTESGKKKVTEKRVIYLTDLDNKDKPAAQAKKNTKKMLILKSNTLNKKGSKNISANENSSSMIESVLGANSKNGLISPKATTRSFALGTKRKISSSSPTITSSKSVLVPNKKIKKVESKSSVPELEIDDLDFLLTTKQPDDVAESREMENVENSSVDKSFDPFLKLDSLYNGTINEDQLTSSKDSPVLDFSKDEENEDSLVNGEKISTDLVVSGTLNKKEADKSNVILDLEPISVVHQPVASTDSLARDLSSHVDSMQGEIDYLKEMLKGEGYSFDPNSLPWLFNDDPLSYGVLPPADVENDEKKNEEQEVSGNELMTYGATNLMDLVDLIGSTASNQDWASVLSPSSPVVPELTTPAPSPSTFSFPSPNKRRKK